jgi:chromate reductase
MKTAMAKFTAEICLLIQGIKGKYNEQRQIIDTKTKHYLIDFIIEFKLILK